MAKNTTLKKPLSTPGSNWANLKSTLKTPSVKANKYPRKGRSGPIPVATPTTQPEEKPPIASTSNAAPINTESREDAEKLRRMILGDVPPIDTPTLGRYIAVDCEMVGVGPIRQVEKRGRMENDTESSLARVSLVNFTGHVVLDTFVKQFERVTDYRTAVSGVRVEDLSGPNVMPFGEVQKQVADILKDRYLVGHAVHNDLKALLLTHPASRTRDTQTHPLIRTIYKTKRPGLRTIIKQEFALDIQAGEHSSVMDARATMALYRLYKDRWDLTLRPVSLKRKRADESVDVTLEHTPVRESDSEWETSDDENDDAEPAPAPPPKKRKTKIAEPPSASRTTERDSPPHMSASPEPEPAESIVTNLVIKPSKKAAKSKSVGVGKVRKMPVSPLARTEGAPTVEVKSSKSSSKPSSKPTFKPTTSKPKAPKGASSGKTGISSGLSTVTRDKHGRKIVAPKKGGGGRSEATSGSWWSEL